MARLDASLTQGLMNPTYASELRNVGATAGMLGGQMRKERRAKEQAQKMAGMDAAGVMAENRKIAETPEQATATALAEHQFGALQTERANAAEDRKVAERARKQTQAEKLAKSKLSGMGKRYDALVRAGETEKADELFTEMEEIAGGAMVEVGDYIGDANSSNLFKPLGGGMAINTRTGEIVGGDNKDGGSAKADKATRELIQKNKDNYTPESWNAYLSAGFDPSKLETIDIEKRDTARRISMTSEANRLIGQAQGLAERVGSSLLDRTGQFVFGSLPVTEQGAIQGVVDTLKSNISFDTLQQMRDLSPTGGALGQVSNIELDMLMKNIGALDPSSPDFQANLQHVVNQYQHVVNTSQGVENTEYYDVDEEGRGVYLNPVDNLLYYTDTGIVKKEG